jgi:hypothetical protein
MKLTVTAEAGVTDSGIEQLHTAPVELSTTGDVRMAHFEVPHARGSIIYKVTLEQDSIPDMIRFLLGVLVKRVKNAVG